MLDWKFIAKTGLQKARMARAFVLHQQSPPKLAMKISSMCDANGAAGFGEALANVLERRPDAVNDILNERSKAYMFLGHMRTIIAEFGIDFVIDAGAHSGQYASTLYGYSGFKGEVHSFEPVKAHFDVLSSNIHYYPGWYAYHCALGDETGKSDVHIGSGHGGTSSLLLQNDNLKGFAPDAVQVGRVERIEVKRVDELFAKQITDPARRPMLKLDVQGFEEQVLRGCADLVSRFHLIQVELSSVDMYQGQGSFTRIPLMLEKLGYVPIYVANGFSIRRSLYLDYDFIYCREQDLKAKRV